MSHKRQNRFENNPRAVMGLLYGLLTLALLVGAFFLVKAVRDEAKRGVERYIVMRERRPDSDIPQTPGKDHAAQADGLERRPYPFRVDSDGYLIPSQVHEKPDATVVFLGGSTTECMYMEEQERFPYLTGRKLEQALGLKVNTLNGGVSGNNTMHALLLLQGKVLARKPEAVVLMECVNDINFLMVLGSYWTPHATRGIAHDKEYGWAKTLILKYLTKRPPMGKLSGDEFEQYRGRKAALDMERIAGDYRKNLELFVFLCRQHGIKPVLMTQFNRITENPDENIKRMMLPNLETYGLTYAEYRAAYRRLLDTMRAVAAEQQVGLIDLDQLVPKTSEYMNDSVHLNARGAALASDIVAGRLPGLLGLGKAAAN